MFRVVSVLNRSFALMGMLVSGLLAVLVGFFLLTRGEAITAIGLILAPLFLLIGFALIGFSLWRSSRRTPMAAYPNGMPQNPWYKGAPSNPNVHFEQSYRPPAPPPTFPAQTNSRIAQDARIISAHGTDITQAVRPVAPGVVTGKRTIARPPTPPAVDLGDTRPIQARRETPAPSIYDTPPPSRAGLYHGDTDALSVTRPAEIQPEKSQPEKKVEPVDWEAESDSHAPLSPMLSYDNLFPPLEDDQSENEPSAPDSLPE